MIIQGRRDFLVEKAASFIAMAAQVYAAVKKRAVIGVTGGADVEEILGNLAHRKLPWERMHLFLLEDLLPASGHPDNTGRRITAQLVSPEQREAFHPFRGDSGNLGRASRQYMEELERCGGNFDLIVAGCGEDGRIASLFPNHHSVENRDNGFLVMEDAPEVPLRRMTASSELVRQADTGILLAFGPSRRPALDNFFNTYLTDLECPAKLVTRLNRYYLLTDQEIDIP